MKLLLAVLSLAVLGQTDAAYKQSIMEWRKSVEADLTKDEGWLSVAGLFWLDQGSNTLGSGSSCKVVLPAGTAPAHAGTLTLKGGKVTLELASGVSATCNGQPVTKLEMKPDAYGAPDKVKMGSATFLVIVRGQRIGIRLFDSNCKGRREFTGEKWYPVKPEMRIEAKYVAYPTAKPMKITNVLGDVSEVSNPGYVEFTVKGHKCRLEAQAQGGGFFFNFRDATTGKTTYPAGRFLDAPKPENGKVLLDFNRATNPPCAFTEFATCPLPPAANCLDVPIEAGEKAYHKIENH